MVGAERFGLSSCYLKDSGSTFELCALKTENNGPPGEHRTRITLGKSQGFSRVKLPTDMVRLLGIEPRTLLL